MPDINTTNGEVFTHAESIDMARLVFKRFGYELEVATAAWRRLLQNGCDTAAFLKLVDEPVHTPHCTGECTQPYYIEDES